MFISDGSGMEKVGFGQVRVYPKIEISGSGMSEIGKFNIYSLSATFVQFEDTNIYPFM